MRTSLIVLFTIAAIASSPAFATKYPPLPTPETLSGTWLASDGWSVHYRLVLDVGRRGTLALQSQGGRPQVYDVETFELNRYSVLLRVTSRSSGEKHEIKGEAVRNRLSLTDKRLLGKEPIVFFPELEWTEAQESLKAAAR